MTEREIIEKELKEQLEYLVSKAKPYTGKMPRTQKSSLAMFIKTKKQGDELLKSLKQLDAETRAYRESQGEK
jgi:hypothetical protein